jgi:uncharacterized protein (TIGR00730 family)
MKEDMSKYRALPELTSICVFCGSSPGSDPAHREAAARLGRTLGREGIKLVYGGGHLGMMGALAEAALAAGSQVLGIIPDHLTRVEKAFLDISELVVVDTMHTRKRKMFDASDAFCVLPGGMGTMDEFFEVLTWKQLRLHNKPLVIVNSKGYWEPLIRLAESIIGNGYASEATAKLFTVVDTVDEVLPAARRELESVLAGKPELF